MTLFVRRDFWIFRKLKGRHFLIFPGGTLPHYATDKGCDSLNRWLFFFQFAFQSVNKISIRIIGILILLTYFTMLQNSKNVSDKVEGFEAYLVGLLLA